MLLKSELLMTSKQMILVAIFALSLTGISCSQHDLTIGKTLVNEDGSQSEWRIVSSKRGRFTIQMPGIPKASTNFISSTFGTIPQFSLIVEPAGTIAYGISYCIYPPNLEITNLPMATILDFTRNNVIGKDGKLLSEREVTSDGRKANEFVFEKMNGQAHVTVQTYFVGNTNYTLIVVM